MTLNEAVRIVIKEDKWTSVNENNCIILRERKPKMTVHLTEAPEPTWIITAIHLESGAYLPFVEDGPWKRICDYLLIVKHNSDYHAVFIELKRTMRESQAAKEQLRRSFPILPYILSVCKIEYKVNEEISAKYIIIAEKNSPRFDKQPVKPSKNETTEKYKGIKIKRFIGTNIPIEKLIKR